MSSSVVMASAIAAFVSMPSARMSTTAGRSTGDAPVRTTTGESPCRTTSILVLYPGVAEYTRAMYLGRGADVSPAPLVPGSNSSRMRLCERSSWATTARSEPLTTKYPPGSSGSSPASTRPLASKPCSMHGPDLSITGMSPMCIFFHGPKMPSCPSTLISTRTGALYVTPLSLASRGVMAVTDRSSSAMRGSSISTWPRRISYCPSGWSTDMDPMSSTMACMPSPTNQLNESMCCLAIPSRSM